MPDTVACAKDHDLTDLSLLFGHVRFVDVKDLRGHALVHVAIGSEGGDHILLLGQPRQHPCLDLCRVGVDQYIPSGRDD